ncbi:hypothetical protein GGR22_001300 [Flavobacterium gossypii]|uniref:PsbP protein n=2 Tax=Flavobacterium TaxID=237 RepID=A0A495MLE8_9FLAO|nr:MULTISPECIES: hypothetical protein [Flavobacterium]MBA9073174.1 hypothetical protein [Flavobacterium gossypii]RKS26200.1 hypothetical protein CLV94_1257 [Flavobacterium endophyticum]
MKSLLFLLLLPIFSVFGQDRFEVENIGFSIQVPKGWTISEEKEVLENIKKFDFNTKQLNELIVSDRGGLNLVTYTKYNPKKYAGIIPTIKIRVLNTNAKNIEDLLKSVEMSNVEAEKVLDDFTFAKKPSVVKISKNDAISFSVNFKLKNANNEYKINSDSYYILRKGYYISINFIEQLGKEDNSELFKTLVESIILRNQ